MRPDDPVGTADTAPAGLPRGAARGAAVTMIGHVTKLAVQPVAPAHGGRLVTELRAAAPPTMPRGPASAVRRVAAGRDTRMTAALTAESAARPAPTGRWLRQYRRNLIVTDAVVIVGVVLGSQALRVNERARVFLDGIGSVDYLTVSGLLSATWLAMLGLMGAWDRRVIGAGSAEFGRIMRASVALFGTFGVVAYLTQAQVSRSYFLIALPLGIVGLTGGRCVWRLLLREYRFLGSHLNSVLVVGGRSSAPALARRLRDSPHAGFRVTGVCVPAPGDAGVDPQSDLDGFVVAGNHDDVIGAVTRTGADMVAVAASDSFGPEQVRRLSWQLEGTGVALSLAPGLTDVAGPRVHVKPVAGLPLMYVEEPQFRGPKLLAKVTLDACAALLGLVLLSPVLLATAITIKLCDRGPVFFRQERVGLAGRPFRVWKFRTMRPDADRAIGAARSAAGQHGAVFYKSATDARVTRVGRTIRRLSIDEIPQLFNVLAGQMSVVGPRPLVPGEGAGVGHFLERRMLVRPGITGLWQVSGRSDVSASERIRLDFYYVENWSVAGDLVIMAKTARAVLARDGAY